MGLVVALGERLAVVAGWLDGMVEAVVGRLLSKMFGLCWDLRSKAKNTMNWDKSSKCKNWLYIYI